MKIPAVAALAFVLTRVSLASPGYWAHDCDGNYTVPSSYQKSLEQLSAGLPDAVSSSPDLFDKKVLGSWGSRVYGLGRCRPGTDASTCKACLDEAFQEAQVICPLRKRVYMYYEVCTLAFADEDLPSHSAVHKVATKVNGSQVPAQCSKVFDMAINELITYLVKMAAVSPHMSATGQKELAGGACTYSIYGLAECFPKMSAANCSDCLEDLLVVPFLHGHQSEWRSSLTCSYRLEPRPLFDVGKGGLATPGGKNGKKQVWIVVGCVAGALIILLVLLLLWWKLPAKRPSAIKFFDDIIANVQGKTIVMFLDYDGTLTPIVKKPERAFMSEQTRNAVRELAMAFSTSVVTGRSCEKAKGFIQLDELHYAGSHGQDIQLNDGTDPFQPNSEYLPIIAEATERLKEAVREIKGASVENNKFCVSVHYREVRREKDKDLLKNIVMRIVTEEFPKLKVTNGKKVREVRPGPKFDKGDAVKYLLQQLTNKHSWGSSRILPIYIGDDKTDEDAFKVLSEEGGFGIRVCKWRKRTAAEYSLKNPSEVKEFLEKLVRWRREQDQV
ncbi:uncharacterized protein LOC119360763 [Triticum dicoccoides]|uniref:uncharacterized protein LOC119360763 n=1 Tax=Triticum dicoccoides TaxID=85692 RepID=UPI001890A3E6|nr:uncharacterized protein LOC119360763 [Triticum dicoccoides]